MPAPLSKLLKQACYIILAGLMAAGLLAARNERGDGPAATAPWNSNAT